MIIYEIQSVQIKLIFMFVLSTVFKKCTSAKFCYTFSHHTVYDQKEYAHQPVMLSEFVDFYRKYFKNRNIIWWILIWIFDLKKYSVTVLLTLAPLRNSSFAYASPKPEAPPLIKATFACTSNTILQTLYSYNSTDQHNGFNDYEGR